MIDESRREQRGIDTGRLVTGVLLVTFGLAFLFDRFDWLALGEVLRWWPLWLIALGVSHVVWPRRGRGRLAGFWPILIGAVFLMDMTRTMDLQDSWPLFVVGAGLLMVLRAMGLTACRRTEPQVRH